MKKPSHLTTRTHAASGWAAFVRVPLIGKVPMVHSRAKGLRGADAMQLNDTSCPGGNSA